jgi:serine/threonine protein kinase
LKGQSLAVVKIADFGLSAFYRPGATMKSSCGTLSFLAPEVFDGTSNAGPPLDVWSLGVILFALLCGDLTGTTRPREAIIKSRIIKGQYKIDENLGPEAKVCVDAVM